MNRPSTLAAVSASFLFLALPVCSGDASAQDKNALVGAWAVVSATTIDASGKRSPTFGPNPRGQLIFTPNGRYSLTLMSAKLPKFASGSRTKGTAEENNAVVTGSISHFGKYTVDDKSFTFNVEAASYPNWDGIPQKRPMQISGNQLTYQVAAASAGGTAEVIWKRIK